MQLIMTSERRLESSTTVVITCNVSDAPPGAVPVRPTAIGAPGPWKAALLDGLVRVCLSYRIPIL